MHPLGHAAIAGLLLFATPARTLAAAADPAPEPPLRPEDTPALPAEPEVVPAPAETAPAPAEAAPAAGDLRPVSNWLEAQVELHRRGFSCGSIDGVGGPQTVAALRAFQASIGLDETGRLDPPTRENLLLTAPALTTHTFVPEELVNLQPVPTTWLEKSELKSMAYGSALEMIAERCRASPNFLKRLNPDVDLENIWPGTAIQVPAPGAFKPATKAARLHVRLAEHILEATDDTGRVIAHFPVSIARSVEKRPVGELHVTVVIANPDYTFDPEVFPESPEAKELGRKLIIQPGPNNPVGVAWIGLDRTGYGIHGTPDPEKVGRTESHGCLRLANWDALTLFQLAWVGLPVTVEP